MKKTLFPVQQDAAATIEASLRTYRAALDASETGVGKTLVACNVARNLGIPFGIICTKSVVPDWERELANEGLKPLFVINYEMLKRGREGIIVRKGKSLKWVLPGPVLLIWDEVQHCRSPFTLNSKMLMASKDNGYWNLMMSATPFEGPQHMRAIGYALGMHTLFQSTMGGGKSWESWMRELGCTQDFWKAWQPPPPSRLQDLHKSLYAKDGGIPKAVKLHTSDLPERFRSNHVIPRHVDFGDNATIEAYYKTVGVPEETLLEYVETGDSSLLPEEAITQLLRARQQAELAKLETIAQMATSIAAEGKKVVVFLNFNRSIDDLSELLAKAGFVCPAIRGGQTGRERDLIISQFQNARQTTGILLVNAAAGGTGISLHDTAGNVPRVSIISPSFSATVFKQVLGRIYRNGMLSDATQLVLLASGTIEERVYAVVRSKITALETIHQ